MREQAVGLAAWQGTGARAAGLRGAGEQVRVVRGLAHWGNPHSDMAEPEEAAWRGTGLGCSCTRGERTARDLHSAARAERERCNAGALQAAGRAARRIGARDTGLQVLVHACKEPHRMEPQYGGFECEGQQHEGPDCEPAQGERPQGEGLQSEGPYCGPRAASEHSQPSGRQCREPQDEAPQCRAPGLRHPRDDCGSRTPALRTHTGACCTPRVREPGGTARASHARRARPAAHLQHSARNHAHIVPDPMQLGQLGARAK